LPYQSDKFVRGCGDGCVRNFRQSRLRRIRLNIVIVLAQAEEVYLGNLFRMLVRRGGTLNTITDSGMAVEVAVICLPARWLGREAFRHNQKCDGELGGTDILDGWRTSVDPSGRSAQYRAFPSRLVHILAGNAPGVAAISIIRGALTKGINLLKLPSNDLFTATAILRTMAEVAPGHPVTKSFSAVYWKGGDERVEKFLLRPIFFDKLVAWGGEGSLRSAKKYIGPGFELVAFDPKTSISMIGREAFASPESLAEVAEAAATDSCLYDQAACTSSRFQFIEASMDEAESYCALLQVALGKERLTASSAGVRVPSALREEVDALRSLDPFYKVWGEADGRGVVILSEDPVDFHPEAKTVNVVVVNRLEDALRYTSVATQTVGVYPAARKADLREKLAAAGAQRIVTLGYALGGGVGIPHDGFFPLHRLVRWVTDEC